MHIHDATEQAYKNGYEAGAKDFAERLIDIAVGRWSPNIFVADIDRLLKEMMGGLREDSNKRDTAKQ